MLKNAVARVNKKVHCFILLSWGLSRGLHQIKDDLYCQAPMPQTEINQGLPVSGESQAQGLYLC